MDVGVLSRVLAEFAICNAHSTCHNRSPDTGHLHAHYTVGIVGN
jgi:hypothetical protein